MHVAVLDDARRLVQFRPTRVEERHVLALEVVVSQTALTVDSHPQLPFTSMSVTLQSFSNIMTSI